MVRLYRLRMGPGLAGGRSNRAGVCSIFLYFGRRANPGSRTFWTDSVRGYTSWIPLGGLCWGFHWFRMAKGDIDSTLRQVYIYLLTIVSSSVAGLVAISLTLYRVFVWTFGAANRPAGDYFQFLGWTIPTIIVTAAIWAYHQSLAQEEAAQLRERRLSARRVHLYIMSFLGLGTMIGGLIILLRLLLNLAAEPGVGWRNNLSLCLALILVGAPLWWLYWNRVIQTAKQGGIAEWRARSRRIYLYVIIGAAIIALATDLVNIIYQILNGGITGNFGINAPEDRVEHPIFDSGRTGSGLSLAHCAK